MNTTYETEKLKKQTEAKVDGISNDFAKTVKGYSSDAVETISEGYDSTLGWIRKNPLQAAAIGAGAGFLIGMAVRSFSNRKG